MSTTSLQRALERLRQRAEADEDLAQVVEFLAHDRDADPFAAPGRATLAAARAINRRRQVQRRDRFLSRAMSTGQVVALISSISDRKAVERRRHRGTLLGVRIGNETFHPGWQFDHHLGETRGGLARVVGALRDVTSDVLVADALMTASRRDLGGRSIADVFAGGDVDLAVRLVVMAGDQS